MNLRPYSVLAVLLFPCIANPLLGQEKAELLGPGVISTSLPEFATSFHPNGNMVFFNRTDKDRKQIFHLVSTRTGEVWSQPKPLPFSHESWRALDPFVSPDGKRLYFSSNRPPKKGDARSDFNTWFVTIDPSGNFGPPQIMDPPFNSEDSEIFVSVSRTGNAYFSVFNDTGRQGVFRCRRQGESWKREKVDLPDSAGNPLIHPDESYLIFAADSPRGEDSDLYIAHRKGEGFGKAIPLGPSVNTLWAEFAPGLHDGYLYFTSERPGIVPQTPEGQRPPGDLYRIPFQPPPK